MVKLNEEIIGGLVSALSRGEPLEKAMMTFYNAGYDREEIEDSAKEVYDKLGPQIMGVKGTLQDTLDNIATKAGVPNKEKPKEEEPPKKDTTFTDNLELQKMPEKKDVSPKDLEKPLESPQTTPQTSGLETTQLHYQQNDDITNKIKEAIKDLKPVNIPSKIEVIHKNEGQSQKAIQHVSRYDDSPKPPSKVVTYVLIVILILLLGALVSVFLFKEDLITFFNNLGLN